MTDLLLRSNGKLAGVEFLSTPGHGYLKVSLELFPEAEFFASGYSYINHIARFVYLEEDCDAQAFAAVRGFDTNDVAFSYINQGDSDAITERLPRGNASSIVIDNIIRAKRARMDEQG